MLDLLDGAPGERLPLQTYLADFQKAFWAIKQGDFWKLERQQTFKEPNNDSWQAFANGRWGEAIRLHEKRRPELRSYYQKIANAGFGTRRVRVVEKPITPYLQWELYLLRIRHEYGGLTRVVGPEQVNELEERAVLPEIYTLGTEVMYQAVYDDDGVLTAAIRYANKRHIQRCRRVMQKLYAVGEDLPAFFDREVAVLGPPAIVG